MGNNKTHLQLEVQLQSCLAERNNTKTNGSVCCQHQSTVALGVAGTPV